MQTENMQPQIEEQHVELVKFDGQPPAPGELKEPVEIMESQNGSPFETSYRAGEGETIKLYTGDGDGAVLAKEEKRCA